MKRKLCALLLALGMIVSFAAAAGAAVFADVGVALLAVLNSVRILSKKFE